MRSIWFKQRFVAPIVAGEKTDTYRPPLDRAGNCRLPAVGEVVGLSVGAATPFAEAQITAVERVSVADMDPARRRLVASMSGAVELTENGRKTGTRFKSLTSVKRWATRYHHAWATKGRDVVVSTADGRILTYSKAAPITELVRVVFRVTRSFVPVHA